MLNQLYVGTRRLLFKILENFLLSKSLVPHASSIGALGEWKKSIICIR